MIAGLTNIIKYNDGFNFIFKILKLKQNKDSLSAQFLIIFVTLITNIFIIIQKFTLNLIIQPIEQLAIQNNISKNQLEMLVEITTTTTEAMLPYCPIMILTMYINHKLYFEIISYMIYPIVITVFIIGSLFFHNYDEKEL
jgi:Na+/H+ antiporter NhaC